MFSLVLLVLALVPPTPKDICNCNSAVDCQCSNLCICKECLATSVRVGDDVRNAVSADNSGHAVFGIDGKQVGWVDHKSGVYRPYDRNSDTFGPPCEQPQAVQPLPTFQQNVYYIQQTYQPFYSSGGCSSGSCSGGSGGGRRR